MCVGEVKDAWQEKGVRGEDNDSKGSPSIWGPCATRIRILWGAE